MLIVAGRDDGIDRFKAHRVQFGGCGFKFVDLPGAKCITCALVPLHDIDGMKRKAQLLHLLRPVGTRYQFLALHQPLAEWPELPKPPRLTLELPMARPERPEVLEGEPLPL